MMCLRPHYVERKHIQDSKYNELNNAQCTPPTTTRLNCRVELCRRCMLNSQLHGGFGWKKMKIEHVENLSSRVDCRIENWVTTADGWVHTARHNSTRLNMFSFQVFCKIRRQSSWTSCEFNTYRATPTRLNSTVESLRCRRCVLGLRSSITVVIYEHKAVVGRVPRIDRRSRITDNHPCVVPRREIYQLAHWTEDNRDRSCNSPQVAAQSSKHRCQCRLT